MASALTAVVDWCPMLVPAMFDPFMTAPLYLSTHANRLSPTAVRHSISTDTDWCQGLWHTFLEHCISSIKKMTLSGSYYCSYCFVRHKIHPTQMSGMCPVGAILERSLWQSKSPFITLRRLVNHRKITSWVAFFIQFQIWEWLILWFWV